MNAARALPLKNFSLPDMVAQRLRPGPILAALPAAIMLLSLVLVPLAILIVYSFLTAGLYSASGPVTVSNFTDVLSDPITTHLAVNSLIIGGATAATTALIGLPSAYWLRYVAKRSRRTVFFLIIASFLASYLVRIYAWRTILGANGMLNRGLELLGITHEPVQFLIFSRFSIALALIHIWLPFAILVLYAGFSSISRELLELASDLGAGTRRVWTTVIIPLMARPLLGAFLFVFVVAASDYVTPQFLGGAGDATLGAQVQISFVKTGEWSKGAAIAALMLVSFLLCYLLVGAALRLTRLWFSPAIETK